MNTTQKEVEETLKDEHVSTEQYMELRRKERLAEDRVREATRARNGFFALIVIWCFVAIVYDTFSAEQWYSAPKVAYIDAGTPEESVKVEEAIDQVVWSWRSRIPKLDIKYVGLTRLPIQNAVITFKWISPLDHLTLTGSFESVGVEQTWIYLDSGFTARSVISLNAGYFGKGIDACKMVVFSHELGHSLGVVGHSPNKDDLMYWAPGHCRPVPTDNDVRLTGNIPTTCHTEMTKDYDLFVPEIYGKEAYLKYEGDFIWSLDYMADKLPRSCSGNEFNRETGELRLNIKGKGQAYSAQFQRMEGDKFKLIYAE